MSVFEENLSEQFSLMAKNMKSRDIVKPSERPHISPPQNISQNHFHKIRKFAKNASSENENIKEHRQNTGKYLSFFRCFVAMTTSYT